MDRFVDQIAEVCAATAPPGYLTSLQAKLEATGVVSAVVSKDTPTLFGWLFDVLSYQGVSDENAWRYMEEHGRLAWNEVERMLAQRRGCDRLSSYWQFEGCGYRKTVESCAEPNTLQACPVPMHDLRNERLNQTAYSLFLFVRDVCGGDLVGWIDDRLARADQEHNPDRAALMRQALLEPLGEVHGVSNKVLSMALADLLLGADPERERWTTTGASFVAIDTLVHNWLHRTGCLKRLGAEHAYGPRCYAPRGCADIVEEAARHIDARVYCPEGPAFFPRLVQTALWGFCTDGALGICNGNKIDDRARCFRCACPIFDRCDRVPLRPAAHANGARSEAA